MRESSQSGQAGLTQRAGRQIRALRQAARLSQEDFAEACGLHRTYIGAIERGEKTVTIETAKRVVEALGLTLSQFFAQIGE